MKRVKTVKEWLEPEFKFVMNGKEILGIIPIEYEDDLFKAELKKLKERIKEDGVYKINKKKCG